MSQHREDYLGVEELCRATLLSKEDIIEIVHQGIVDPSGNAPIHWQFDATMVTRVHKAVRIQRDFDIDWPGIALALELLEQLEAERRKTAMLEQRLSRFIATARDY
ncbi:MAG: chaperone modulator CbpM [Porticoccaceae bacterium]